MFMTQENNCPTGLATHKNLEFYIPLLERYFEYA